MNQDTVYQLIGVLDNLQSPEKSIRNAAEDTLNQQLTANPTDFFGVFAIIIRDANIPQPTRRYAAVLFRQFSRRINVNHAQKFEYFISLSAQARLEIQAILFEALQSAPDKSLRNQIGNALSEVARQYVDNNQDPSSLETIVRWSEASQPKELQEAAFRILTSTPQLLVSTLNPQNIFKILYDGLNNPDFDVRLTAIKAMVAFIQEIPESEQQHYFELIPTSLAILEHLNAAQRHEDLCSALQSVLELVGSAWEMFQNAFAPLIQFSLGLIQADSTDDDVRQAALELMTTFAELAPDWIKDHQTFTEAMTGHCLRLMSQIDDDDEDTMITWNASSEVDEDSESISLAAERSLDRLALSLGGDSVLPYAVRFIPQMFEGGNWKMQHAALMAISVISEGCHDEMIPELKSFLDLVIPMLSSHHPRVQWAACNAIGQMSTDFCNDIQNNYANDILPNVIPVLASPSPRVQAHAAASLVNFCEEASPEVLQPFLPALMDALCRLMKGDRIYVQEQTFSTIAAIANAIEEAFGDHYQQVMPYLFDVLERTGPEPEFRLLKAKAMECTTLIALAVKKERMGGDIMKLVRLLILAQESITDESDPQASYLLHSWCRLSRVLGHDFEPYLKYALPPVLKVAETKVKFKLLEEDEATELKNDPLWHVRLVKGQYLGLNTGIFDEQCAAIELLSIYAQSLGGLFEPYVQSILENIVINNLLESPHPGIQTASASCIPSLLSSFQLRHVAHSPAVKDMWNKLALCLTTFLSSETNANPLVDVYGCYYQCVEILGTHALTQEQMMQFIQSTATVLSEFDKPDVSTLLENPDSEDEETESYQSLLSEINRAFHSIFKSVQAEFLGPWSKLQSRYETFANNKEVEAYRQWVLCLYDDVLEFCGPQSAQYYEILAPVLDAGLQDSSQANRQAAAYGIGVAAKHGGQPWATYVFNHLPTLFWIVQQANEIGEDAIYARENACSSIAIILDMYSSAIPNFDAQVKGWIPTLPVVNDNDAAIPAYAFLLRLMEEQHSAFAADGVRCLTALSQAFEASMLNQDLKNRAVGCLMKLSTVPGFADVFNSVPEHQRNILSHHVSAGQTQ